MPKKKTKKAEPKADPTPDDRLGEGNAKRPTNFETWTVVIFGGGYWGKGRTLEQAAANYPNYKTSNDVLIYAIYHPKGSYIHPDSMEAYDDVYVDELGRLRYPTGSRAFQISRDPHQLRKLSEPKN